MAITVINLESAITAFDELCNQIMADTDVDTLAPAIVAKQFDGHIDEALDSWLHVGCDELNHNLAQLQEEHQEDPMQLALDDLLYEIHQNFGNLGLIIRVVLLDRLGNLLVQTEEIDNDSYRFHINSKNGVVQHSRHRYFGD